MQHSPSNAARAKDDSAHLDAILRSSTHSFPDEIDLGIGAVDDDVAAVVAQNDTPLSGYTSDESAHSAIAPPALMTDDELYKDMTFLSSSNSMEMDEIVAEDEPSFGPLPLDLDELDGLLDPRASVPAIVSPAKQVVKFFGVTPEADGSSMASYGSMMVARGCATPEQAAHAVDSFLQTHYPQQHAKFANFCVTCGKFTNPLGLAEFVCECTCGSFPRRSTITLERQDSPTIAVIGAAVDSLTGDDEFQTFFKEIDRLSTMSNDTITVLNNALESAPPSISSQRASLANSRPHSASQAQPRSQPSAPVSNNSSSEATVQIKTDFLTKYWRNDRKNLQCFPYCQEHGDYYRVRMENLKHERTNVCRAPVKAVVTISSARVLTSSGFIVFARCNNAYASGSVTSQMQFTSADIDAMYANSAVGQLDHFSTGADGRVLQFEVTFYPDYWKLDCELTKKRVRASQAGKDSPVTGSPDTLNFVEVDVLYTTDKQSYERLGYERSKMFEVGNTRTLLRIVTKAAQGDDTQSNKKRRIDNLNKAGDDDSMDGEYDPDEVAVVADSLHRAPASYGAPARLFDPAALQPASSTQYNVPQQQTAYFTGPTVKQEPPNPSSTVSSAPLFGAPTAAVNTGGRSHWETQHVGVAVDEGNAQAPPIEEPQTQAVEEPPFLAHKPARSARALRSTKRSAKQPGLVALFCYSLTTILLSAIVVPLGVILLLMSVVCAKCNGAPLALLNSLGSAEVRWANKFYMAPGDEFSLNRLSADSGISAALPRILYFIGGKLVVAVIAFALTLVQCIFSLLLTPVRRVSAGLRTGACASAVWTRGYTRSLFGTRTEDSASTTEEHTYSAMA